MTRGSLPPRRGTSRPSGEEMPPCDDAGAMNPAPASCDLWIERFCLHLRDERGLSVHTVRAYRRDLASFVEYLDTIPTTDWRAVDASVVRSFVAWRHRRSAGGRSIQRGLSALRSFFEFCVREAVMTRNPARAVSAPRSPKRLPNTLDTDRMGALLEFDADDPLSVRDRAMLELTYSSGLRLSELCSLAVADADLDGGLVRVLGKGRKTRLVPIGRHAREALRAWLTVRSDLAAPGESALFVSTRGRRIAARARCRSDLPSGPALAGSGSTCTPTCFATRSRRTCWSRVETFARFRSCSATPTSRRPRCTPTWTFSTSRPSTTAPIHVPARSSHAQARRRGRLPPRAVRPLTPRRSHAGTRPGRRFDGFPALLATTVHGAGRDGGPQSRSPDGPSQPSGTRSPYERLR